MTAGSELNEGLGRNKDHALLRTCMALGFRRVSWTTDVDQPMRVITGWKSDEVELDEKKDEEREPSGGAFSE